MAVVYDEVFISTMKEINVCKGAIKKLSRTLADMEKKYGMATAEFMEGLGRGQMRCTRDYKRWHDSYAGLMDWEQRLKEFQEILENAAKTA